MNEIAKTHVEDIAQIVEKIRHWPKQPGVYIMRDEAGRILYVGKAKNLKNRIRSYFQKDISGKTQVLIRRIQNVEYTVTNTELEALLLECNLIKKHRPRYNIRLKDDKNYPYVVLDFTHPFPQFRITRKVYPSPHLKYFGPFSGGIRDISRFLLKTFQLRDCSDSKFKNRKRPCLNFEIGICTAPCVDYVTQDAYMKQIHEALLFLKGKKSELLRNLKTEMALASKNTEFERAKILRDKIHSIERLSQKQDAVLPDKVKDIDVIGCYVAESEIQWVVLFIRGGYLIGRRSEKTPLGLSTVEEATRTFLEQFYLISLIPDEMWLATDFADRLVVEKFLQEKAARPVKLSVKRSEKPMRLLGMAYENAKLLFEEGDPSSKKTGSEELMRALSLREVPDSIEGIDISNFQGAQPVASLVHFSGEKPLKSHYRLYHPKTVVGQDDFAMIYETVLRRYGKGEPPPDLLMIDGGIGQLRAAQKALDELKIQVPLCSLAKARTESSFTSREVLRSEERIFLPNRKNPVILREGNPGLRLLQQVRDEAHRFAGKGHQIRRKRESLHGGKLDQISGVGETVKAKLLKTFGSLQAVFSASDEELKAAGINENVRNQLKEEE